MGDQDSSPFGELLRLYRVQSGWTQEELAERAGISVQAISTLERGTRRHPRLDTVRRLADALALSDEHRTVFLTAPWKQPALAAAEESSAAGSAVLPPHPPGPALHPTNLPDDATSFIGRQQEVTAVAQLLRRPDVRLVTLTGPGGVGKTRLATHVGRTLLADFPHGVFFVSLASLTDPLVVPSAIATELGVREAGNASALEQIIGFLDAKRLLLVLDNFEHLPEAVLLVASLLDSCRGLEMLVTSRVPLHLSREHEYAVPPLAVPDLQLLPDHAYLSSFEAVDLFVERAGAVKHDFFLTDENAVAVAEITARLDGLPLAIELAAALIKLFPPPALLQRLSSRLTFLTGQTRDRPARHQTLKAAIDWSYSLLSEEDQILFARLSVFAGGCTVEATEALCNIDGDRNLVEGIASLIDWSLLRQDGTAEPRFRMLETIREYAIERLVENGEAEKLRNQHAAYYEALVEETAMELDLVVWLGLVEDDLDNVRLTLRRLLDAGEGERVLELATCLYSFWNTRCFYLEGQRWLEEGLARGIDASIRLRAEGFGQSCVLATMRGDYERAMVVGQEALRLQRELGDSSAIVSTLLALAFSAIQRLEYATARNLLDESLERSRTLGYTRGIYQSLLLMGEIALNEGDWERSVAMTEESLALIRTEKDSQWLVNSLDNLARALLSKGDLEHAIPLWMEGLDLAWKWGDRRGVAYYLEGFAAVAAGQDMPERAAHLAGAAHALRDVIRSPLSAPEAIILDRFLGTARGRMGEPAWTDADQEGGAMTLEQAIAYALEEALEEAQGTAAEHNS